MNRHGHHNIQNGIVWAQTGHSTGTCTATLCVIKLWTHQKFELLKKNPQRRKSNSNLITNSKNHRNRSNWFRAERYCDYINLVQKFCQVYSSVMNCTRGNLERRHYDRRHWRTGGDGRIWTPRPKAQCKGKLTAAKKWKLHLPSGRWNSQKTLRDRRLRTSTLTRKRPERGEDEEILRGESDGSLLQPLFKMTQHGTMRRPNMISGLLREISIYRHHVKPRLKLYMPQKRIIPFFQHNDTGYKERSAVSVSGCKSWTAISLATTSPTRKRKKTNTMGVLREDFHSGGATTMNFIVNGTNAVNSFIMRSTIPWKRLVPRDNTTFAFNLADVNGTLHDVAERRVVESAGFFTRGTWLDKHFHETEMFGADGDGVFVWRLAGLLLVHFRGRFVLCVEI